jgi:hypothetical protein
MLKPFHSEPQHWDCDLGATSNSHDRNYDSPQATSEGSSSHEVRLMFARLRFNPISKPAAISIPALSLGTWWKVRRFCRLKGNALSSCRLVTLFMNRPMSSSRALTTLLQLPQ